jgi:hypothetical protein
MKHLLLPLVALTLALLACTLTDALAGAPETPPAATHPIETIQPTTHTAPTSTPTPEATPQQTCTVSAEQLNIRSGPGTAHPAQPAGLTRGEIVQIQQTAHP